MNCDKPGSIEVMTGIRIGSAEWPLMMAWEAGNCHHERFPPGKFTCYGCSAKVLDGKVVASLNWDDGSYSKVSGAASNNKRPDKDLDRQPTSS